MDWGKLDETVTKAVHRLPLLERAKIAGGWAGLRPLAPDDHAIIGPAPAWRILPRRRLLRARLPAFPMTGRMVAEWIVDGKPSMDLSLFNPARFGKDARLSGDGHKDKPDAGDSTLTSGVRLSIGGRFSRAQCVMGVCNCRH